MFFNKWIIIVWFLLGVGVVFSFEDYFGIKVLKYVIFYLLFFLVLYLMILKDKRYSWGLGEVVFRNFINVFSRFRIIIKKREINKVSIFFYLYYGFVRDFSYYSYIFVLREYNILYSRFF